MCTGSINDGASLLCHYQRGSENSKVNGLIMELLDQKRGPLAKYGNQFEAEDVALKAHDGPSIPR
jgi:hypothetical protein